MSDQQESGPVSGGHESDVRAPVTDWLTDFDHQHPDYAANAPAIWEQVQRD